MTPVRSGPAVALSALFRALPIPREHRQRVKDLVYARLGPLFRWSHNYALWREDRKVDEFPEAAPPQEPLESDWVALAERRQRAEPGPLPPGAPYVVVPVYRGQSETLACLYSVLAADPTTTVVAIDDRSPEPELRKRLARLAGLGLIELLENRRNLGFAATANRGMAHHPDRDVVLLNSDTEVFGDWLWRLSRAAHAESGVGTVTPLTNNGEICSYPYWVRDNPMALELDYAELDELASAVNRGLSADAPTGVGFCFYVRRRCLDEVGALSTRFGRGYGEENEFCLRAAEAGWRSVIAGDVFVRHVGRVSFRSETRRLRRRALRLLHERFPSYDADIQEYIQRDPVRTLRLRLDLARLRRAALHADPRKTVLYLVHDWGGGTQQHVEQMQAQLEAEGVNVFCMKPSRPDTEPRVAVSDGRPKIVPNAEAISISLEQDELVDALRVLEIDHIHVHHLADFGDVGVEWLAGLARGLGVAYDVTLHDYTPACPRVHLMGGDGRYCGLPPIADCESCVATHRSPFGYQPVWRWRARWGALLADARRVFCPSRDMMDRMRRVFPEPALVHRPHPEPDLELEPLRCADDPADGEVRVVALGAINQQKGYDVLLACASDARARGLPIRFTVVGFTENDALARRAGVHVTGRYRPGEVQGLLEACRPTLAFFPTLGPETYSFTFSIALRTWLFPVVFDLGAIAERLADLGWGRTLPLALAGDPAALNDALLALRNPPAPPPRVREWAGAHYASLVRDYYEDFAIAPQPDAGTGSAVSAADRPAAFPRPATATGRAGSH